MTEHDKALWLDLCDKVASGNKDVSRIHAAAKRLKGRPTIPDGWYFVGSPFQLLFAKSLTVKGGDAVVREQLRGHAQKVRDALGVSPSPGGDAATLSPTGEGRRERKPYLSPPVLTHIPRRHRADIDD